MMTRISSTRTQILLADDNDAARESIIAALGARRFDFFEADCGWRAVEIARCEAIDLTFLDWQMPDITGLDVLRLIRRFNATVPCILVSGERTEERNLLARQEGAAMMLDKPLTVEVVRSTVQWVLRVDER